MTVEDPAKRVLLQARLKAFAISIRNGGGDERVNCKGSIDSNLLQMLMVTRIGSLAGKAPMRAA